MKTKIYTYALLAIVAIGCSKPSFLGVKKEIKESVKVPSITPIETNTEIHQRFLKELTLPSVILDELLKEQAVIVTNYSQYPFDGTKDSGVQIGYGYIDHFLLNEVSITLNRLLLGKGVRILENDGRYNKNILYNFDKASAQLNFEMLHYGIYYEQISFDSVVRHINAGLRYKVVTSKGMLKQIEERYYSKSDTLNSEDIRDIEKGIVNLGYPDAFFAERLSVVGTPSNPYEKIGRVLNFKEDTTVQIESVTALKFDVPNIEKQYALYALDYSIYETLKSTKEPTADDILPLNPKVIILAFKEYEKLMHRGVLKELPVGYVTIDTISELFVKTRRIVILDSSGKLLVVVHLGDDGIITAH